MGQRFWEKRYLRKFGLRFENVFINLSICARYGLIQSKLVHRTYYTNAQLSEFYDGVSPACNRCQHSPIDFIHTLLLCPTLQDYWSEVMWVLSQISAEGFKLDAFGVLFGVFPSSVLLSSDKKDALAFLTFLARWPIITRSKVKQILISVIGVTNVQLMSLI